ncbi:class I SAM-dependent methyltransferase [Tabrizicola sp. J26]|uniref:class I SAM-dependent methyltransferase n=1 Tax=Alitabrizicola rongguiensis TaxID=2909234 RepID=UPI001F32E0D6|nr:class I SAM-dependent methyltransferase [Tabrizicola rongguiensis]MCF1708658.1 class I SAM-dependent methyltransferase [Tabrizicola rongguiensis]
MKISAGHDQAVYPDWVSYDPDLVPSPTLMGREGIINLEEWFRWAEEWSMLLRVYGRMSVRASVLEIGCGQGRIAFALRFILQQGRYLGFDISSGNISRLQAGFQARYPNFQFVYEDLYNTHYNPTGKVAPAEFRFPAEDSSTDLVYAASIFTHMLPPTVAHYFKESARVLRPGGRCVFSFFLFDHYRKGQRRPLGFARPDFNFDHSHGPYGSDYAIVDPFDVERMTAFSSALVYRMAEEAGLKVAMEPVPGLWSGSHDAPVGAQDIVVLEKP